MPFWRVPFPGSCFSSNGRQTEAHLDSYMCPSKRPTVRRRRDEHRPAHGAGHFCGSLLVLGSRRDTSRRDSPGSVLEASSSALAPLLYQYDHYWFLVTMIIRVVRYYCGWLRKLFAPRNEFLSWCRILSIHSRGSSSSG